MKKSLLILYATALIASAGCNPQAGTGHDTFNWDHNRFSMFVHFGLYSRLGGVWEGIPITEGYSEQIRAFANIPRDSYAAMATAFTPHAFCADSIASLAAASGAGAVVFTAKHHDGFCLYHSKANPFNITEKSPGNRDLIREMADACAKYRIGMGLYYSLIDWNFTNHISPHNADPISDSLHRLNIRQVTELLTDYGPVSELWFDMGSLTPSQSQTLYDLVHRLQPQCKVSGRLGNNCADFVVMPDNAPPEVYMAIPWQCPASIFPETWGWRSWQKRGDATAKADSLFEQMRHITALGGHYLLNIGPDSTGAVIPFEQDVFRRLGRQIEANPQVLQPAPRPDTAAVCYAYASQDYYTTFRTRTAYRFDVGKQEILYTETDAGSDIAVETSDNEHQIIKLPTTGPVEKLPAIAVKWGSCSTERRTGDRPRTIWETTLEASAAGDYLVALRHTGCAAVYLNKTEISTWIARDDSRTTVTLRLPLLQGANTLQVRCSNRFGREAAVMVSPLPRQIMLVYKMKKPICKMGLTHGVYGPWLTNLVTR